MAPIAPIQFSRSLNKDGKQAAVDQFVSGREMSDIAGQFSVSRRHVEQCVREAIIGLAALVHKPKPQDDAFVITEEQSA